MKTKLYLLAALIIFSLVGTNSAYAKEAKPEKALTEQQQVRVQQIEARVLEIKNMDKSNLSRTERKQLRKELGSMNKEMKAVSGGGVYLSVGAIIIIILLLILIL
ncbi:MAG: hypothetical protein JWQ25_2455 [Daejeonella sp.]|nr:hypothetical protein [Daejeonella sp.]